VPAKQKYLQFVQKVGWVGRSDNNINSKNQDPLRAGTVSELMAGWFLYHCILPAVDDADRVSVRLAGCSPGSPQKRRFSPDG